MAESVELISTPESGPNAPAAPNPPVDPALPPETPEDLAKSYAELRAKFTQTSQELAALKKGQAPAESQSAPEAPAEPETPAPETPDEPSKTQEEAAQDVAEAAGFDLNPYNAEYEQTGNVSEESRAKIAEGLKGVLGENAREIVDQFIEARKVVHENDRKLAYDEAGGEAQYKDMVTWAKDSLTPDEIRAYNATVNSGDRHATLLAIRGLRSKYEAANGRIPNNVSAAGSSPAGGVKPFSSAAEMVRAMSDPLYQSDPAFRDTVKARIAASPNL